MITPKKAKGGPFSGNRRWLKVKTVRITWNTLINRSATDNTKVSAPQLSNYTTLVAFLLCGEISTFFDIFAIKPPVLQPLTAWQGL